MRSTRTIACLVSLVGLAGAASTRAQDGPPFAPGRQPGPPYRLGLVETTIGEVEIVPGVRARGVEILGVAPGSPAARSGLEPGDVILAANSARVNSPNDLRRALATSGGRLRLKVFDAGTEQVLVVLVRLGSPGPGPGDGPTPIIVTGRIKVGAVAIGGETTGTTLTASDGATYDLEFGPGGPPRNLPDGQFAVVSGLLRAGGGPERPGRQVIRVSGLRVVGGGRPRGPGVAVEEPL